MTTKKKLMWTLILLPIAILMTALWFGFVWLWVIILGG